MKSGPCLPPAIVLGVDTPIGLTVVRELGSHGVPVIAVGQTNDAVGRSSRFTRRFVLRPHNQSLARWLPRLIAETGAQALLAISENDLLKLAEMPPVIGGCRLLTPRETPLAIVLDKTRTMAVAQATGIDVPDTWQPRTGEDFVAHARSLDYPVALKWSDPPAVRCRLSRAGVAFRKVDYADHARQLVETLARYGAVGVYPMIQSWCPGYGFGQMLLMVNGKAQLGFQHRRLHEWPTSGGVSTLCTSVPMDCHSSQFKRSEALLAAIGWEGPAMVEYRHDPTTGRYWLMEINGRFWGSLPLARHCGACFAWEQYRFAILGAEQPERNRVRMRQARYMIPETRRLLHVLRQDRGNSTSTRDALPTRLQALAGFTGDYLNPRSRYYVFSLGDPGPFFRDMVGIVNRRLRRSEN